MGDGNYGALCLVGAVVTVFIISTTFNLIRETNETSKAIRTKDRYTATVRSFDSFFRDLLPSTFQYNTVVAVFLRKLVEEHDCLCFCDQTRRIYQNQAERNELWLLVCFKMLTLLSCNVVLAVLYYPSDHGCRGRNLDGCERIVKVKTIGSLCTWNEDNNICENSSVNDTFCFTLSVLFATMCATSLLDKLYKFTLSHAALAVKTRRLGWLYKCCLRSTDLILPAHASHKGNNAQRVRKMDRYALGMPTTALVVKPSNTIKTQFTSGKVFLSDGLEGNSQDATLSLSLEEAEQGYEHFGDEWKALSVQSRQST